MKIKYWPQKIRRILRYLPILWHNSDCGATDLYSLIERKLKDILDTYNKCKYIDNADVVEEIKAAIIILDRLVQDHYWSDRNRLVKEKWGEYKFQFIDSDKKGYMVVEHEKDLTEGEKEQCRKDRWRASEESDKDRQKDIDLLFDKMKRLENWWP